jgi:hypothetical protein
VFNDRISKCSAEECEAAIREFREVAAERRRLALRGARAVRELVRTGAHFRAGAASLAHFAEMNGLSAYEAREWTRLDRAVTTNPSLEAEVERGTIPVASAATLGDIAAEPELIRPDDRWIEWAKSKSTRDFRRLFARRRDESRAGESVSPVTAYVTLAVRENLERAGELTSRKAHEVLTLGQTLGIVLGDWLDDHDPLRKTPGTRRLPDTSQIPDSRYVPAEVDREVRSRSEDRCNVPLCTAAIWVQRSHRVPHRDGGSREAGQLDLLCDYHHRLYEVGLLRIDGTADAPVFTDARGNRIDERHPFAGDRVPPKDRGPVPDSREAPKSTKAPSGKPLPNAAPKPTRGASTKDRGSRRPPAANDGRAPPAR